MIKSKRFFALGMAICLLLCSCTVANSTNRLDSVDKPDLPEKLTRNSDGLPILNVYDASAKSNRNMDIEEYVTGVVAGEMKNNWPIEALKAQAILARTFVLKFCDTKNSKYEGADISTDIEEAQAYAPENINERVRKAIEETKGMVMSYEGEYPYAWFYAHSGGKTELPSIALDFNAADPEYLTVKESPDSEKAPEDVKNWQAEFTLEEILGAVRKLGVRVETIDSIKVGEKGASGRAKTLIINEYEVSAPSFRIVVGANKLKSTLISDVVLNKNKVVFYGSGYGHGVGMSQWGAYALAKDGKSASEIVRYYFDGVDIVDMW